MRRRLIFVVHLWTFQGKKRIFLGMPKGMVYTSLLRLQRRKWIASEWGTSENNRKAKYYSITKSGRKQPARETAELGANRRGAGRLLRLEGQE
jgi:PadR family transcriptional regulator, regulatory protein PadR